MLNYCRARLTVSFKSFQRLRPFSGGHLRESESRLITEASSSAEEETRSPFIYFHSSNLHNRVALAQDVKLFPDFVSHDEEVQLDRETHQQLRRLRYEEEHWDDAIRRYREIEKSNWSPTCQKVIQRMRGTMNASDSQLLSSVHVLDLAPDGFIKPHIDSERYCGDIIAGISLLSDSVMRLVHKDQKEQAVELYLKRYSLYILKGIARYEFTHEILPADQSYFNGLQVPRTGRRLAVICRLLPKSGESGHTNGEDNASVT